jgi:hypothetical protein
MIKTGCVGRQEGIKGVLVSSFKADSESGGVMGFLRLYSGKIKGPEIAERCHRKAGSFYDHKKD